MSDLNCNACEELREYAPDFVQNGVTNTVCNSMKNDTGINPAATVTHTDCEDLDTVNDCLVGRMDGELEAYDQCDWKKFMHKFIPNIYTVIKLMICAICGIWNNIHAIWSRLNSMCSLMSALLVHPVHPIGTLPNAPTGTYRGGTLGQKNGVNILVPLSQGEVSSGGWPIQNVGIRYGTLNVVNCETGNCQRHEWIAPNIYAYKFNPNVTPATGDVLWSIDKASLMAMGFTEEQWQTRVDNPIAWTSDFTVGSVGLLGLRIGINNNRMELSIYSLIGGSYANVPGKIINPPSDQAERLYRFNC